MGHILKNYGKILVDKAKDMCKFANNTAIKANGGNYKGLNSMMKEICFGQLIAATGAAVLIGCALGKLQKS